MLFYDYENSPALQHVVGKEEYVTYILSLGLTEEAGEVAGKVKKLFRNNDGVVTEQFRQDLKKELGDVLWYLTKLGHHFGMTLDEIAVANMEKLHSRMQRGTILGEGDNR